MHEQIFSRQADAQGKEVAISYRNLNCLSALTAITWAAAKSPSTKVSFYSYSTTVYIFRRVHKIAKVTISF